MTIGKLPETNLGIVIKDLDALITHNTSILGILGIGKSCLTFELIQKTLGNLPDIKIVCIDITNQYKADLKKYIEEKLPSAFVEGGGHKNAGALSFLPYKKEEVVKLLKEFISNR